MQNSKLIIFSIPVCSIVKAKRNATKSEKEPKLSRTHAPPDLSPIDWQRGLRRQFGGEQAFVLENKGSHPFFQSSLSAILSQKVAIVSPFVDANRVIIFALAPIMQPMS